MKKFKKLQVILVFVMSSVAAYSQPKDPHFQWLEDYTLTDARKTLHFPEISGYFTLSCDFHMHTYFSDGHVTPLTRVREAWREGLHAIAITDHTTPIPDHLKADYNTSFQMAQRAASEYDVILIQATEYTQREPYGHLNFLFISDANPFAQDESKLHPADGITMAADNGAFVILNHPGWPDKNSDLDDFHIELLKKKKIHGIEVINGMEFYPLAIDHALNYDAAMISATDIHAPIGANYHNKIRNLTLVFAKEPSEAGIREALFAGRTLAFANNILTGKTELLIPFLRNSLTIEKLQSDATRISCLITNHSDITWYLYGPNHRRLVLPARKTIRFSDQKSNTQLLFEVRNTYVNSAEHLLIPLNLILTPKEQTLSPFIKQNFQYVHPGTLFEIVSPSPESKVFYSLDGSDPDQSALQYDQPIHLEKSTVIKARAYATGLKESQVFEAHVLIDALHQASKLRKPQNGLKFQYFEGPFLSVNEFEPKGKKVSEGIITFPDISKAIAKDHFGFIFSGYLYAPESGEYEFILDSDDGAVLKMAGIVLVDNDGSHSLQRRTAKIKLAKGYHAFELRYFDDYDEEELNFSWIRPSQTTVESIDARYFFIE